MKSQLFDTIQWRSLHGVKNPYPRTKIYSSLAKTIPRRRRRPMRDWEGRTGIVKVGASMKYLTNVIYSRQWGQKGGLKWFRMRCERMNRDRRALRHNPKEVDNNVRAFYFAPWPPRAPRSLCASRSCLFSWFAVHHVVGDKRLHWVTRVRRTEWGSFKIIITGHFRTSRGCYF